jgi:quercetin dioxygenase-like cupin family protein
MSGHAIVHADDIEKSGNWLLVRRSLGLAAFGINMVEIAPGESIPEHDETGRDQTIRVLIASAPRESGYEPMGWA